MVCKWKSFHPWKCSNGFKPMLGVVGAECTKSNEVEGGLQQGVEIGLSCPFCLFLDFCLWQRETISYCNTNNNAFLSMQGLAAPGIISPGVKGY